MRDIVSISDQTESKTLNPWRKLIQTLLHAEEGYQRFMVGIDEKLRQSKKVIVEFLTSQCGDKRFFFDLRVALFGWLQ